MTKNEQLAKIENLIDQLIDKMYDDKNKGNYLRIATHRTMFNKLIRRWEETAGESVTENARIYNKISKKYK